MKVYITLTSEHGCAADPDDLKLAEIYRRMANRKQGKVYALRVNGKEIRFSVLSSRYNPGVSLFDYPGQLQPAPSIEIEGIVTK